MTIPSPSVLHFRGGRKDIDATVYPDLADYFDDLRRPGVMRFMRSTPQVADICNWTIPSGPTCALTISADRSLSVVKIRMSWRESMPAC
jgi:hypothetical protein